jgi:hypothetical protein
MPPTVKVLLWFMWAGVAAEFALVLLFPKEPTIPWQATGVFTAIMAISAGTAALAVVARMLDTSRRAAGLLLLTASLLLPVAALRVAAWEAAALVGLLCIAALAVVELKPLPRGRFGAGHDRTMPFGVAAAGLALIPWFLALAAIAWSSVRHGAVGPAFNELAVGVLVLALFAYGIAAAIGVTHAVPRRQARILRTLRRVSVPLLVGLLAAKMVYQAFRATVAPDLFGDRMEWEILDRSTLSWLHALLLVGVIVAVLYRSSHTPLVRSGLEFAVPAVATVVAVGPVLELADVTTQWGWLVVDPGVATSQVDLMVESGPFSHVTLDLQLVGALALGLVGLVRWVTRGWDAGVVLLVLASLYIAPRAWNGLQAEPPGIALHAQVDVVATWAVIVLLAGRVANARLRRPLPGAFWLSTQDLARLTVTTFVAVHAVALFPAGWADGLVQVLAAFSLLAVVAGLPPVAADPVRRVRTLFTILAAELATTTALLLLLVTGDQQLLGLLGLYTSLAVSLTALPLAGLFTVRMASPYQQPAAEPAPRRSAADTARRQAGRSTGPQSAPARTG